VTPFLAQLAPAAGVLDELELHVIPVLFGEGRALSRGLAPEQIQLKRTPFPARAAGSGNRSRTNRRTR
jgi:dihydrofolate reductase